ncbi:Fe-only nitrogenase accessory protein AnfO [Clostridium akagii]|uniref:Fe-only nitrogenase accessory protein AnfO n=1 Tax=Clostridium akagii TaxID=91623 RepID=UPI0004796AE3|nr:Fe-only nitrogenase accessory protein AnfO [Clostridium akagii]
MGKTIAVFLGINGATTSLNESGVVKVYSKENENWKVIKEILLKMDESMSIVSIRENIQSTIEALGDCRIFIGNKVTGIPYTILEKIGYNIWEIEGKPEEFLDYVLENEYKQDELEFADDVKLQAVPCPVSNGKDGYFSIDLKKIQEGNINYSSKQVLLPFLNNTPFYELEIICSHEPKWLDMELKRKNLKADVESNVKNKVKITVSHKVCGEL